MSLIVDEGKLQREADEFAAAFEEDVEDRQDGTEKTDESSNENQDSGESTEDSTENTQVSDLKPDVEDSVQTGVSPEPTPATDELETLKVRVTELEDELKKERQRTSSWDGRIKSANQKVKDLEAENNQLKDRLLSQKTDEEGQEEKSDQEKLAEFKVAFPELHEFADIIDRKIKSIPEPTATPDKSETVDETADEQETPERDTKAEKEHLDAIVKAHPEKDEMVSSGVVLTYINKQETFIRDHLLDIYYGKNGKGSTDQVIDLLQDFKNKTGWKSQLAINETKEEKAKQDKLNSMLETGDGSAGPKTEGPDKNDFAGTAKDIGL